jgi:hypothetical protein
MTTGFFDFLPFIDGWDYHIYIIPYHQIVKGNPVQMLKIEKRGWILRALFATTDAYGTITYEVQGPGGTLTSYFANPETAVITGNTQYDPTGYLAMYNRPVALSTNGFYTMSLFGPGYTGTPFPFVKEIRLHTYLDVGSTQNLAFLTAGVVLIEIKDEPLFFNSLRKLGILPALEQEDISKTLKSILEEIKRRR